MGMEVGADFVPIISFGELDAIKNVNLPTIQAFFRKYFGAPVPFIPVGTSPMIEVLFALTLSLSVFRRLGNVSSS